MTTVWESKACLERDSEAVVQDTNLPFYNSHLGPHKRQLEVSRAMGDLRYHIPLGSQMGVEEALGSGRDAERFNREGLTPPL